MPMLPVGRSVGSYVYRCRCRWRTRGTAPAGRESAPGMGRTCRWAARSSSSPVATAWQGRRGCASASARRRSARRCARPPKPAMPCLPASPASPNCSRCSGVCRCRRCRSSSRCSAQAGSGGVSGWGWDAAGRQPQQSGSATTPKIQACSPELASAVVHEPIPLPALEAGSAAASAAFASSHAVAAVRVDVIAVGAGLVGVFHAPVRRLVGCGAAVCAGVEWGEWRGAAKQQGGILCSCRGAARARRGWLMSWFSSTGGRAGSPGAHTRLCRGGQPLPHPVAGAARARRQYPRG